MTVQGYAAALNTAADQAMGETVPRTEGWWPFRKTTRWRPDQSQREWAKKVALAAISKKVAETGTVPSKAWLAEHVRIQMGVKENTRSALWIAFFVARLLLLLLTLTKEPTGQENARGV